MIKQCSNAAKILVAFLAVGLVFVSTASAGNTPHSPSELPSTVTITGVENSKVTASDFALKRVTILSYVKARGLTKKQIRSAEKCRMIGKGTNVPVYTNSGVAVNGGLYTFEDTRRTRVCRIHGHWRKVKCGNFIWFHVLKRIIKGPVLVVRSFAHMRIHLHVVARVKATASCGWAYAAARVNQVMRFRSYARAKKRAPGRVGRVALRIYARIFDKAKVRAVAKVHCEGSVTVEVVQPHKPPPPPPPGPPSVPPKNGEEGAGEGSGGPGNGCAAGYSWNGTECVETNPEQSGEPGEGSGGYCRDPETGDVRPEEPGEEADQFGYCVSS